MLAETSNRESDLPTIDSENPLMNSPRTPDSTSRTPHSILIVQTGFLGDAVLATGMLRALRDVRPDVRVGFLVRESVAELFEGHPGVDRLHRLDKKSSGSGGRMAAELRAAGYGAALIPHRSLRSALICHRAGIPVRVGFRQSDAPFLLTRRVEYRIAQHELDRNAALVEALGFDLPAGSRGGWLEPREELVAEMRRRHDDGEPIVLIAPGSVWATKRWTPEGFAGVARRMSEAGMAPLLIGSAEERELCSTIVSEGGLPAESNLAGSLSLPEHAALVSIARRLFTNDSAPLHIAESLGVPVTAIFGPTVPEFGFGPRLEGSIAHGIAPLACRPCRIHGSSVCPIGTHECMKRISAEEVGGVKLEE
jgi:heptosyltransferase-2